MSAACQDFRRRLEQALRGAPAGGVPSELAWEEHLVGCAACRRLLEAEEALEALLATLPEPKLPPDLAARVLAALAAVRRSPQGDSLDRLLELDSADERPAGLEERVRSALSGARGEARRELRLDRLLGSVPAPVAPPDLATRVLARLAAERGRAVPARPRLRFLRGRRAAAAAAVLLATLVLWRLGRVRTGEEPAATGDLVASKGEVDKELLGSLDVLENWDLLTSTDVDVLLAELDGFDGELLTIGEDGTPTAQPPAKPAEEKHG